MIRLAVLNLMIILSSIANAQYGGGGGADAERYARPQVHLMGSMGQQDYSVGGGTEGTSINLKTSAYTQYGLMVKWNKADSVWGLQVSGESRDIVLTPPIIFSPNKVHINQVTDKFIVNYRIQRDSSGQPIELGLGYRYSKRTATNTTPAELVTNETKGGPLLNAKYIGTIDETFNISAQMDVGLVNFFNETKAQTGNYRSGYTVDSKLLLIYPTSRLVDISIGLQLYYDSTNYNGTGDRHFTSAHETTLGYGIPLELSFFF